MSDRILAATTRLTLAGASHRTALIERIEHMAQNPEDGFLEDVPWKGILLVGGITVATAVVAAIGAYMTGVLGKLPG